MRYQKLARTEIEVSAIAFGGFAIGGGPGRPPPPEAEAEATVRAAWSEGVTFFVTSDSEGDGRAERVIGRALEEVRSKAAIATRTGPERYGSKELEIAIQRSLQNLGTDYLDLFLLDGVHPKLPVDDVLLRLDGFRKKGLVRAFGVAHHGRESLAKCTAAATPPCCVQAPYSLLFRAAEADVLPACAKHGLSMLACAPLMLGLLAGRFERPEDVPPDRAVTRHFAAARAGAKHGGGGWEKETFEAIAAVRAIADDVGEPIANVSMAWVLAQKQVAAVIVGARSPLHAKRNARAGNLMLPFGVMDRLAKATQVLKERLGPSLDMWEEPTRYP